MQFFNPDGSEAEKSGNGLRIFGRYLWDQGYVSTQNFEIIIQEQAIAVTVKNMEATELALEMGQLSFFNNDIPLNGPLREVVEETITIANTSLVITAVTIGNPHCIIFTESHLLELAHEFGPLIETNPLFPNRTNVQFAQVIDQHTIAIEIWERGAGYTLASGTSACAAAGAAIKTGHCTSPLRVHMAGGSALVEIDDKWQVTLTGNVEAVCHGQFSKALLDRPMLKD
jgi:diaminopimelate epimerase